MELFISIEIDIGLKSRYRSGLIASYDDFFKSNSEEIEAEDVSYEVNEEVLEIDDRNNETHDDDTEIILELVETPSSQGTSNITKKWNKLQLITFLKTQLNTFSPNNASKLYKLTCNFF